ASLVWVAGCGLVWTPVGWGDDRPPQPAKAKAPEQAGGADRAKGQPSAPGGARPSGSGLRRSQSELAAFFSQAGDDPPRPFVPLRPATVEDRRRTEAVRLYSAARALEDQRKWSDALALLQEA